MQKIRLNFLYKNDNTECLRKIKGGIGLQQKNIDGDRYLSYFYLLRLKGENC